MITLTDEQVQRIAALLSLVTAPRGGDDEVQNLPTLRKANGQS